MLMREKIILSTLVLGDSQEAVLALDLVIVKAAYDDFQDDNLVCEGEQQNEIKSIRFSFNIVGS